MKEIIQIIRNELIFKGPFPFNVFKEMEDSKKVGIYIWGFVNAIFRNMFIPYYVGETGMSLRHRILREIKEIQSVSSTWTRPSSEYITTFFIDPSYPIRKRRNRRDYNKHGEVEWLSKLKNGEIVYSNNRVFVEQAIGLKVEKANNYPISLLAGKDDENDFLKNNIDDVWVSYATIEDAKPDKKLLEYLESLTKFSLKGKTEGAYSVDPRYLKDDWQIFYDTKQTVYNDIFARDNDNRIITKKTKEYAFEGYH
jgi:hypothetical protein